MRGSQFSFTLYLYATFSGVSGTRQCSTSDLGPVHTNPFSNENGTVLLPFQKDLRPHLSFSYRFRRPYYNAVSALKTLLYPQCACLNELDACAFQYIVLQNWREIEATWQRLSAILATHRRVILMTSPFSNSTVFSVHTRKQRFQKASFFKLLHSGERFRMAPFSVIVFGVVVWTTAVSRAKQLRFRLKTD